MGWYFRGNPDAPQLDIMLRFFIHPESDRNDGTPTIVPGQNNFQELK